MLETRNESAFATKSPITTYRQLTNQIHNMNPLASKSVTLKLNRILIHLQPPTLAKQENQKYIKSANNSLSSSIIVNKPEKGSPLKKTLFEFPKQGLNKSKESFKPVDVSQKKDVYLKNPHQRSLSHGHLRPMEKSESKDSTTFIKNIGTPQAFRIEKAPTVARPKVNRVGEHYYKLSALDTSGLNKSKLPSDSLSRFSKLHSRQGSVVDLKPDFSKLEDEAPSITINSNPKRATSRRVKIKSVDLGVKKIQPQPVLQGEGIMKWRNLIFNPNATTEVLKGHVKLIKEGLNYAINNLKPPSISYVESRQVIVEKRDKKFSKTLILDLDETLISSCKQEDGPDLILTPREGIDMKVMIKVRPYAQQFLKIMKEHFEIFVFTASSELYAKTVVKALDPQQECISYVFHRQFCFETNKGLRIKDLRIFRNRELKDLIIVDNFVPAFSFQIENGVPILEWKSDKEDKELVYLVDYLVKAKEYKDIRDYNREKLGLLELAKESVEEEAIL